MDPQSGPMIMLIGPEAGAGKTGCALFDTPRSLFFGVEAKIMTTARGLVGFEGVSVVSDCNRLDLLTHRLEAWRDDINGNWPGIVIDDVNDMIQSYASYMQATAPENDSFYWSKNTTNMIARFKAALREIKVTRVLTGHLQPAYIDDNGVISSQAHLKMPLKAQRGALAQDAQMVGWVRPWRKSPDPLHKWGIYIDNDDPSINVTDRLGVAFPGDPYLPLNLREYHKAAGRAVPARADGFTFLDDYVGGLLETDGPAPGEEKAFCLSYARQHAASIDPRHIRWILRDYFAARWYGRRDPLEAMFA